jgi:hypothetical protein
MVVITQGIGFLFPPQSIANVLRIAPEFLWRFYCSFYLLFIVTGILVPLFYYLSDFNKDTVHKELSFALKYALLIWTPNVFAMVAFGVDVFPYIVFFFFLVMIIIRTVSKTEDAESICESTRGSICLKNFEQCLAMCTRRTVLS